jgi:large subunit ribosomal protein L17
MRHGKKVNHLGRTAPHRKAMMANMASSLIKHKKITTTVAKAKALRTFIEPLITKGKDNSTHNYRTVFAYLGDKEAVTELFTVVGEKVASRPGGYTRILKIGNRAGDNADMAMIELVDFNEYFTGFGKDKKAGSKRTRRGGAKAGQVSAPKETTVVAAPVETAVVDAPVVDEVAAVIEETSIPAVEEVIAVEAEEASEETVVAESEVVENPTENISDGENAEDESKDA